MNIFKSFIINSIVIFFSRILGFVRDVLIAKVFGASIETDAFFVAFRIPNLLRRIFAEGAFSQSFIPILTEYKNLKTTKKTKKFISHVSGMLIFFLIGVIFIGILFSPVLISLIAPHFCKNKKLFYLTVSLLRYIFPYIFFVSLASMFSSILNVWNYFFLPSLSTIFLNFNIIFFIIFSHIFLKKTIFCLVWGTLVGGLTQLLYQVPTLQHIKMLSTPIVNFTHKHSLQMLKLIIPALLGSSVSQLASIINMSFSSLLDTGSISWMYYADRLLELPTGILGLSLGNILFPLLTASIVQDNITEYNQRLNWGLFLTFMIGLPSTFFLFFFSKPLTISCFQFGTFNNFDTCMTAETIKSYALGIIPLILIKIFSISFFSLKDFVTPIKCSISTIIINITINSILVKNFKHIGLACSMSFSAWFNSFLLYWLLRKKKHIFLDTKLFSFLFKIATSTTVATFITNFIFYKNYEWGKSGGFLNDRILEMSILTITYLSVYFVLLKIFKLNSVEFIEVI